MALDDFWASIRTAASLHSPTVAADTPEAVAAWERILRQARLWLTPRSVEGYDPVDFSFLDEGEQTRLRDGVERFRAAAGQVAADAAPTERQAKEGDAAFRAILALLRPHRFRDAESFRTQILLDRALQGGLPPWVTAVACETGTDLGGDPAIWIWVDVTDEATRRGKVEKEGQAIHDRIESAYHRIGGRRWPYIRFRSPDALPGKEAARGSRG